jgi:hypothetical protein
VHTWVGHSAITRRLRHRGAAIAFAAPRPLPTLFIALALATCALQTPAALADDSLDQIREDVRTPPSGSSSSSPPSLPKSHGEPSSQQADETRSSLYSMGFTAALYAVTSPIWVPHFALGDNLDTPGYFPRFPYDNTPGYMLIGECPGDLQIDGADSNERSSNMMLGPLSDPIILESWRNETRTFSGRWDAEYGDQLDRIQRISSHMLLERSSRWGYKLQWDYLEEQRTDGRYDHMNLGDFNFVFRFAQSERAQFRTGIGFNWLEDSGPTDFGFNFTYGADFYPFKPLIISSVFDWGTLGYTDLFRGRLTIGAILRNYEIYTGYEYLDIGRTNIGTVIGGLRLWF